MSKDENPLWRKYMNNVDMMDNKYGMKKTGKITKGIYMRHD